MLEQLPDDILGEIFKKLAPEDLLSIIATYPDNKRLHEIAFKDFIWLKNLEIHFPDIALKLQNNPSLLPNTLNPYYSLFIETYEKQYQPIIESRIRAFFSRIKEGKNFSDLAITAEDLHWKDANGKSVIDWAREKNYPPTLQKLHEILFKSNIAYEWTFSSYFADTHKVPLEDLELAILFRQPKNAIKNLLRKPSPNSYNPKILCALAVDGNLELFQFFIEYEEARGRNLIQQYGTLYLFATAFGGHISVFEYLLKKNVNLNLILSDQKNTTVLSIAIYQGHLEIVKYLLEKDKRLIFFHGLNTSLVILAGKNNHPHIVTYLLDHIEKTTTFTSIAKNKYLKKDLYEATKIGALNVVQLLLKHNQDHPYLTDINEILLNDESLLTTAAAAGHLNMIQYLIKIGADPNTNLNDRNNPLYKAIQHGHLKVATFLNKKYPLLLQNIENKNELLALVLTSNSDNKANLEKILNYLFKRSISIDASTLTHIQTNRYQEGLLALAIDQYLKNIKSPKSLIKKLQLLDNSTFEKIIILPGFLKNYKNIIKESRALFYSFQYLSQNKFQFFFAYTIKKSIFSIDDFVGIKRKKNDNPINNFENNYHFIQTNIAVFTAHRKNIEKTIQTLEEKSVDSNINTNRKEAIAKLVRNLKEKTTNFFTNPNPQGATNLLNECEQLIKNTPEINQPQNFNTRKIYQLLLIAAHFLIIPIPFIWSIPKLRNVLLNKTDTKIKAENVLEDIQKLAQSKNPENIRELTQLKHFTLSNSSQKSQVFRSPDSKTKREPNPLEKHKLS